MSTQQARLLRFLIKYPGWQSYGKDCRATLYSLEAHGLLELNRETKQMRLGAWSLHNERGNV